MVSTSIPSGGICFGSLELSIDGSACHSDAPLNSFDMPKRGSIHYRSNARASCVEVLARLVPRRRLKCSIKPRPQFSHGASQLVGMIDTDSLYPLLESCSKEEDICVTQAFVAKVFMASTPPPDNSNRGGGSSDLSTASHNVAMGEGKHVEPHITRE